MLVEKWELIWEGGEKEFLEESQLQAFILSLNLQIGSYSVNYFEEEMTFLTPEWVESQKFRLTNNDNIQELQTVDYRIKAVHLNLTYIPIHIKGELTEANYIDSENNIYIKELISYTKQPIFGNYLTRQKTIRFYRKSNEYFEVVKPLETYDDFQSYQELEDRRKHLIAEAKKYFTAQVQPQEAFEFLVITKTDVDMYIAGDGSFLVNSITTSDKTYMTQEIKDTLIEIITY